VSLTTPAVVRLVTMAVHLFSGGLPGRCCLLPVRSRALTGMIHLVHSMVAGGALARVPEAAAAAAGGFLEQLLAAFGVRAADWEDGQMHAHGVFKVGSKPPCW
jgi:hypothetical protein